jgi:nucleoside-diphosphate-sugar epimerase
MQVILGAGGAIGKDLARELKNDVETVRLASRNPQKVNSDDETLICDLTNLEMVEKAVASTEVAYLVAGLQYNSKVWEEQWPVVMENVIEACKKHQAKLVFFDNIYMLNPEKLDPMTEDTEVLPSSRKGKVRAKLEQMILDEISAGTLDAMIARSADFYGPGINNSVLIETVFKNMKKGKKAIWFCSTQYKHNYTYTPDAAKATALLGNTESAYGQIWHLPTTEPLTGKEWIEAFAKELGVEPKIQLVSRFMIKILGLFNPVMKEFVEMLYQFDRDYNFDSSKFENVFNIKPTPVEEAIKRIIKTG